MLGLVENNAPRTISHLIFSTTTWGHSVLRASRWGNRGPEDPGTCGSWGEEDFLPSPTLLSSKILFFFFFASVFYGVRNGPPPSGNGYSTWKRVPWSKIWGTWCQPPLAHWRLWEVLRQDIHRAFFTLARSLSHCFMRHLLMLLEPGTLTVSQPFILIGRGRLWQRAAQQGRTFGP